MRNLSRFFRFGRQGFNCPWSNFVAAEMAPRSPGKFFVLAPSTFRAMYVVNAALLFGKRKAKTDHATQARQHVNYASFPITGFTSHPRIRSHSVATPNLGGFAGFSVKYPNAKVSLGYRADFFFGAMDAGIDARRTKDAGFHGPFATVSIGLGG